MNMLFDFVTIVFYNHLFQVDINKIYRNTCKDHNLYNKLQVDEILSFSTFLINGALKCIFEISVFPYYYQNASNFYCKIMKKYNIYQTNFQHICYLFLFHESFSSFVFS
jgi:hypothetical protein